MKNFKAKLAYAFGDIYGGAAFLIFSLLYLNFLVLVEGLPVVAASAVIFIGKLWDAVTDPIMGNISDKTRTRFGRRRFYFLIGIIPVFLSFVMLFYSFGIASINAKIAYHTFAYMFFGTAFTIVMVPYNAILSEMTSDYNERTSFTTGRMLMSGAASLVAAVVPSMIIKGIGGEVNGPDQRQGYLIMAVAMATLFGLCWLVTFLGTWERAELMEPAGMTLKKWLSVFKNRSYRVFIIIFLSFQIAVDLMLALFIFYIDIVVLRYQDYETVIGVLLACSLIFLLMHSAVAKKWGKAAPLFIGMPVWILSSLAFIFVDTGTPLFVLCALAALIAIGSAAGNLSTWSMLTDIYDVDEIMTGERREGIYSGFTTFLRKFASGIAVLILGIGLGALGFDQNEYSILRSDAAEFDPASYAQSSIVNGIKWMFVLIPIILLTITLLAATKYKLNNKRFNSVLKGIETYKTQGDLHFLDNAELLDIQTVTGKFIKDLRQ